MEVFQCGSDQDGFVHFDLRKLVTQAEAMGKTPRLTRMPGNVSLEGPDIPVPEDSVESPVKISISLFVFSLIHAYSSCLGGSGPSGMVLALFPMGKSAPGRFAGFDVFEAL